MKNITTIDSFVALGGTTFSFTKDWSWSCGDVLFIKVDTHNDVRDTIKFGDWHERKSFDELWGQLKKALAV